MSGEEREVALVAGASRGIGRAIAVALAESGRHVIVNYRANAEAASETLRQIESAGGSGELAPFDVADAEATAPAIAVLLGRHGHIDVLVNNAGVRSDMLLVWMEPQDWHRVLDTDLTGFYHVTRPVVKEMLLRRSGRIVNIASTSGQSGMVGQVSYSAAKGGLIAATQALAREVARRKVTVNAIAPGYIDTDMLEGLDRAELARGVPMGRLGTPREVAAVVVFLSSPEAAYITGQTIGVNGGVF